MTTSVSVSELKAHLKQSDCSVVAVRSPEDYALGSVPGAHSLLVAELPARWTELPQAQVMVTLCTKGGGRSEQAAAYLRAQGRNPVYYLAGGYNAFINAAV